MPRILSIDDKVSALQTFYRTHRRAPTCRECLGLFDYASTNSVHRVLERLEDAGYIVREDHGRMALTEKVTGRVRMVGDVSRGLPRRHGEEFEGQPVESDYFSLGSWLVDQPESSYLLRVDGKNAIPRVGIFPGDLVLVERTKAVADEDVVLVEDDGRWILGRLREDGATRWLEGRRSGDRPRFAEDMQIRGKVKGLVRKW